MLDYVTSYLHSNVTPGQAGNWLWALIYIALIFAGVSGIVIVMNWGERKALAHMQVRLGPMRVGPHGLMQPIADAIKLLTKEHSRRALHRRGRPPAQRQAGDRPRQRRVRMPVGRHPAYRH